MAKPLRKNIFCVIWAIIIILICFGPYFQAGVIHGSDEPYHLTRINTLANAIANGIFPVKVHFMQCYTYGYGTGFFYSDLYLYLPAILINLGLSLETAYKIYALFILVFIYASMFFATNMLVHNPTISSCSASIFLLSNLVLAPMYKHFQIGTIQGLTLAPLAIASMLLFLRDGKKLWLLLLSFVLLFHAHTISLLLTFIVCFILFLFYLPRIIKERRFLKLMAGVILAAMTSCSYWLPMWEQTRAQTLKFKRPWTREEDNVRSLHSLWGYNDGLGYILFICLLLLIACVLILIVHSMQNKEPLPCDIILLTVIGMLYTFLPSNALFWQILNKKITVIQFPNRLYNCAGVCILLGLSLAVSRIHNFFQNKKILNRILWVSVIACLIFESWYLYTAYPIHYFRAEEKLAEQNLYYGIGSGEEWLPVEIDVNQLVSPHTAVSDLGIKTVGEKSKGYSEYFFTAKPAAYYIVPYVYYRGYAAEFTDTHEQLKVNAKDGYVVVCLPEDMNESHEIKVFYNGTKFQKISYLITLIGIAIYITQCFRHKMD